MENQLFTGTSVPKAYLKLSMPLVFSMVVTLLYNLADTYFVARTGNTDLMAGVSLGAPVFTLLMAVVNLMQSASMVLTNQFLLPYGNDKIAAMGIVLKVSMIVLLLLTGFAFGGQPLFGYYYGAGDKERFARLLRFCVKFLSAVALVLSAVVFGAAPWLMRLFLDKDGVVRDGALMLRCQVVTMVFVGFVLLMTIVFQSMGKAGASFVLSISRQGVVFVAVLLVGRQLAGYNGILLAQAVADTLTMLGALVLFRNRLQKQGYA